MGGKISKTKQMENFKSFIKDKKAPELFQLRLDHETVYYDNDGQRTTAQIARNVRLPIRVVSLLLQTPLTIWDSIMDKLRYWDWIERQFGESVKMSVICRNEENCPCGTIS